MSEINLSIDDILIERLAAAVHRAYCKNYMEKNHKEYWTHGNYDGLDEETKQIDRDTVRAVLDELDIKILWREEHE